MVTNEEIVTNLQDAETIVTVGDSGILTGKNVFIVVANRI